MRVKDLLKNQPQAVAILTDRQTFGDAIQTMMTAQSDALVVTSDIGPTGILTRSDVFRAWFDSSAKTSQETELREALSSKLITAAPDDDIADTIDMMLKAEIGHMPICEDGKIMAILSIRDLVAHHLEALNSELEQMNDYIERLHDSYED